MTSRERIDEIRHDVTASHRNGDFGETFCYHIHRLNMTFKDCAEHFGITLFELADLTADHIRRLDDSMVGQKLDDYLHNRGICAVSFSRNEWMRMITQTEPDEDI